MAGAGLAIGAGIAALYLLNSRDGSGPIEPPVALVAPDGTSAPAAAVVVSLKDGGRTVTLDANGRLSGGPALSDPDREAVVAALRARRVEIPADVVALAGRSSPLRGTSPRSPPFGPVSPVATAVGDARPTFEWRALDGASSYVVAVFDRELRKVAESASLTATRWTADNALPRGRVYSWQVRARAGSGDVLAPGPEARFSVLTDAESERVTTIRIRYAGSALALGVLLAGEGLLDDARREIETLVAENPSSADARQLLASLTDRQPL